MTYNVAESSNKQPLNLAFVIDHVCDDFEHVSDHHPVLMLSKDMISIVKYVPYRRRGRKAQGAKDSFSLEGLHLTSMQ